eukprot:6213467-Pleurochrysis_carterae.AAC.1
MSQQGARFPTDITLLYEGGCDSKGHTDSSGKCNMCARVGDTLADDIFGNVVLLGRTEQGDLTVRRRDGEIVDRTVGHLQCIAVPDVAQGKSVAASDGDDEVKPSDQNPEVSTTPDGENE